MDTTAKVVEGIRTYILSNPTERSEILACLSEMADKLEAGTLNIIDSSKYIKDIKQTWSIAVYEIFSDVYRKASKGYPSM
jgi:hypothetical protein